MKLFFVFLSMTSFLCAFATEDSTCDYSFGDPTWNYSKVFYNQDVRFPAGAKEHSVILPAHKGFMISYVCINLPDNASINKKTTKAAYDPLDREVSIVLAKGAAQEFDYHVYAKQHGF